ncbi:MAG: Neopullulanase 2 [Bacteroidetes bacterium ADurb.Bin408]|nr:MAG: Neopullulanase 2 [Bacteroidetes bacterium ADurb.Bin408]
MKKYSAVFCLFFIIPLFAVSQGITVERMDPPFWWAGMKSEKLQLLIKANDLSATEVKIDYEGLRLINTIKPENKAYLILNLEIGKSLKPGTAKFRFMKDEKLVLKLSYEFRGRDKKRPTLAIKGFGPEDLIYLIMPDRFANGDTLNDTVQEMNEKGCYRDSLMSRHGGDLQGIIDNMAYLRELGVTTLWLNPVFENNQPFASYHGYAVTDHYKIDPRLGNNEKYRELVQKCQTAGIKVIMDMVYNHIGSECWFYKSLPFKDWVHQNDTFIFSNFRVTTLLDNYASAYDRTRMKNGWFDRHMPDLNYDNPYLRRYMIQNALWWIEYTGINGFRFDTYAYSDMDFMRELLTEVFAEYPSFNAIGEVWDNGPVIQAYFTAANCNNKKGDTRLPGTSDFQLYHAINNMINEEYGWNSGVERVYYTLCSDIAYNNPFNNLIFLDNHDVSRFFSVAGGDMKKFKIAVGFLMTTRGTPMLYYGTEILMKNFKDPDEKVREDFPGGWADDASNKFTYRGRNNPENEAFNYVKTLANWRKRNPAVQSGKLMQFVPENGVYVYFRYNEKNTVMIVINTGKTAWQPNLTRYAEMLKTSEKAFDVISGALITLNSLQVAPMDIRILDLVK